MMRARPFHCLTFAAVLLLAIPLCGQQRFEKTSSEDAPQAKHVPQAEHVGYPHDWSSPHLLMPGKADDVLTAGDRDPRYVYNWVMRQVAMQRFRHPLNPRLRRKAHVDWSVSLANGYVPQNQFPAKFQFDVTAENCNSDYLLLGLTVKSGTQANLVGINNLYTSASPACNSGTPWVAFAFNTLTKGGQILTSPELSEDGTKVAFVESVSSGTKEGSYFHVLVLPNPIPTPPSQYGTVTAPKTPSTCTTPTTVDCMTTLTIQTGANDSNSSPWIDYNTDTAYVAADNGVLYKITPVFGGGAPALVSTGGWPVTVSTNKYNTILTAPVVDDNAGMIFIGDGEGYLYSVSLTGTTGKPTAQQTVGWAYDGTNDGSGDAGTGIVDPPIAVTDPANSTGIDQVFAFTGCSEVQGIGGAVTQVAANFTTGSPSTANTVNLGSASGDGDCTGLNVHSGAFDNEFWLTGSASGHFIACGFVNDGGAPAAPVMYFFPFASNVITSTGSSDFQIGTTKGDECSPLTEFYNGSSDMLFFGVGDTTNAYVESSTITSSLTTPSCTSTPSSTCVTSPDALGGTSGIVIDNQLSNGGTNIYFSTLAPGSTSGEICSISGVYCAVKLTQSGLQ
jgi:hypothetical protein